VWTAENRQRIATLTEIRDLRVRARQMAQQMELLTMALDQERNMARNQPAGPWLTSSPKSCRSRCAASTAARASVK
jgi:hypothetical protein